MSASPSPACSSVAPSAPSEAEIGLQSELRFAAAAFRSAVEGDDNNGELADWFRPAYLRGVAALIEQIVASHERLEAGLLAAQRDAERIDALEAAVIIDEPLLLHDTPHVSGGYRGLGIGYTTGRTLREAIDHAFPARAAARSAGDE